jgi:hypothetical protein
MDRRLPVVALLFGLGLSCGSESSDETRGPDGTNGGAPSPSSASGGNGRNGPNASMPPMTGLFTVHGKDARGSYEGEVELTANRFVRTVRYPTVKVEDGRELHWAFAGEISGSPGHVALKADLRRADFVSKRGAKVRTIADGPIAIGGKLDVDPKHDLVGTISGPEISLEETWTYVGPSDGRVLYRDERTFLPGHAPPSPTQKSANFSLYADYHELDVIKPYKNRKEFQDAIHGNWIDKTDFDFYQKNPNALRVAQKVIDEISLAETLVRANAYRRTLAEKAVLFQKDMDTRFVDKDVGMVAFGGPPAGPYFMSGDAALWTGTYVAAQAYRYQVTGDAAALATLITSLEGLLKLQEITGDWTHFARSLRKSNGPAIAPWRTGTGKYAGLDWMEGGNNDMIKGLFYGYLMAHDVLCTGALSGYASYCARIVTNAKHLADDVKMDLQTSDLTNSLPSTWLYAVLTTDVVQRATYQAKAEGLWSAGKNLISAAPVFYDQGIVDWSGTHLSFVGDTIFMLLAKKLNLGGDAQAVVRQHIDKSHKNLEKQRFAVWHFLDAAYGSSASATLPGVDDARWRLREMPHPKMSFGDIDRRIAPEFCMSPYPSAPWKQDWMQYPETDRTQGLGNYPLFEAGSDELMWKVSNDYHAGSGYETTSADYLHVYWFARKHALLSPTE